MSASAPSPRPTSLTQTTIRGFAWAFTGTMSQAVLQIVSMVVLARLLTPAEFGAAAAAGLVVGLSQIVSQIGVGPALVQRRSLTREQIAAAVYASFVLALLLSTLVLLLAPLFNRLVGLPSDSSLLRLLTVSLLLSGVSAVPMGLLQREMRLRTMALVDFVALGPTTIGISIVLAWSGMGALALIIGQIAGSLVTATGYFALARPPLRVAGPAAAWHDLKPLLRFGSGHSLSQLGNWFALNADNFVTANLLGPSALGLYTRAYNLLSQPANTLGSAMDKALFPAMCRVREDGERLRAAYVRATSLVAMVTVPASLLLVVLAPDLVRFLLGPGWSGVVAPLQVFALVLLPRTAYKISGSLTRATGAVFGGAWRQWLYASAVLVGAVAGSRWGVGGVAVGASVAIVLHYLVMLQFSARISPGLVRAVFVTYLKYVPLACVSFAAADLTASLVRPLELPLVTLLVTGLVWAIATLGALALLRRWLVAELEVIRSLLGRTSQSTLATALVDPEPETSHVSGP